MFSRDSPVKSATALPLCIFQNFLPNVPCSRKEVDLLVTPLSSRASIYGFSSMARSTPSLVTCSVNFLMAYRSSNALTLNLCQPCLIFWIRLGSAGSISIRSYTLPVAPSGSGTVSTTSLGDGGIGGGGGGGMGVTTTGTSLVAISERASS